ncbi:hypothetical protein DGI_2911 [Megalodesulfovibrio gigas DSM 1382 = ATCC 19364]|uniref:Uncharacterized protein n=1 Tax=Megalodesulfovibrio gigas (strain ATCC 19364 / DSM 1382 / NCIMB 9332 / VKM B-1759) TaxID=1121448 RepID=T2GFG6_MEGG1|nr:hypothetical protein DGI_2911 [Megalodesulfovibrio gigas DSM 1382 = ATCC 19364]
MQQDPIAELYAVAAALQFLEDSFGCHGEGGRAVRAEGAAYVTGLMGRRVDDIATLLAAAPGPDEVAGLREFSR